MLTWQQTEFLLKGVYLGILVMIAWMVPRPAEIVAIAGFTLLGLVLFLGIAAYRKMREGYRVKDRWLGFLIFLLLENPGMVYAGLLVGLSSGVWLTFDLQPDRPGGSTSPEALWPVAGGAVLGMIFYGLRHFRLPLHRLYAGLGIVAVLVGGFMAFYYFRHDLFGTHRNEAIDAIGGLLALGLPGFYLLTFAGFVEESEIEIGAMCAALGIAIWSIRALIAQYVNIAPVVGGAALLIPLGVFFVYTTRVMPGLRVFKHALRGMSYRQMGQTHLALASLNRALQYDPKSPLARQQMWDLHRDLNFAELKNRPDLVPLLNFEFCLERISNMMQTKPPPEKLAEAIRMLDLIAAERPNLAPVCAYWKAIALLHGHQYEEAAKQLASILELPQYNTAERQSIHFQAWQLALFGHPEMNRLVAQPLLAKAGHRMDAIAAVEMQLARTPEDPGAWDMKRQLYAGLTEEEYWSLNQPGQPATLFNHEYAQQLGLALLDDPAQWQRGCAYLRIAAHGMPARTPNLLIQIAATHEKHGDLAGMWDNYLQAMRLGRSLGVANIDAADREALFATVKKIGDLAIQQDRLHIALEAYKFYSQNENAGIETWRMLADLFERTADVWQALHCTEHALRYNAEDPDLKARKDRYYYSIQPDEVKARWKSIENWFDAPYCREKAKWVLEKCPGDFEMLDWASHMVALALVAEPESITSRWLLARIHRLRGEVPEAIAVLEHIRQNRPEKIRGQEETLGWFFSNRMLGDLYLDSNPAEAVTCYLEFRKSDEAGADTSFKLGKAYEATGDLRAALACYQEVVVYEKHPMYYDARDAIERIKSSARKVTN